MKRCKWGKLGNHLIKMGFTHSPLLPIHLSISVSSILALVSNVHPFTVFVPLSFWLCCCLTLLVLLAFSGWTLCAESNLKIMYLIPLFCSPVVTRIYFLKVWTAIVSAVYHSSLPMPNRHDSFTACAFYCTYTQTHAQTPLAYRTGLTGGRS